MQSVIKAALLITAAILALCATASVYIPFQALVLVGWAACLWVVFFGAGVGSALLSRWMMTLFWLPFVVLTEYALGLHPDYGTGIQRIHALTMDTEAVYFIGLLAAVGACAFAAGLTGHHSRVERVALSPPTIQYGWYFPLIVLPAIAFWRIVPDSTILSTTYGEMNSGITSAPMGASFSGLSYLLYVLMIGCYLDISIDANVRRRRAKRLIFWTTTLFVIVIVNLLRGNRGATGLIIALGVLHATRAGFGARAWKQLLKWAPVLAIVFVVLVEMDWARALLADRAYTPFDGLRHWSYKEQTWMGATWSCFGLADTQLSGGMHFGLGATYWSYFLSLPPSVIANLVGYERPIGAAGGGPSWWFEGQYTSGGLHPVVVPYHEFGLFGVVVILFLIGVAIRRCEHRAFSGGWGARLYYGAMFVASLHWFWYGDMYIVRALMGAAVVHWTIWTIGLRRPLLAKPSRTLLNSNGLRAKPVIDPAAPGMRLS